MIWRHVRNQECGFAQLIENAFQRVVDGPRPEHQSIAIGSCRRHLWRTDRTRFGRALATCIVVSVLLVNTARAPGERPHGLPRMGSLPRGCSPTVSATARPARLNPAHVYATVFASRGQPTSPASVWNIGPSCPGDAGPSCDAGQRSELAVVEGQELGDEGADAPHPVVPRGGCGARQHRVTVSLPCEVQLVEDRWAKGLP